MTRKLRITLEQAKELLVSMPSLTEVIYSNFPELKPKPLVLDKFEDLNCVKGYFISSMSNIAKADCENPHYSNKNVFATEKQAKSVLAYAQLTQLMKATGDCNVNWNSCLKKYSISRLGKYIAKVNSQSEFNFLAFNTESIRDEFYDKHQDLLKQFFQIY